MNNGPRTPGRLGCLGCPQRSDSGRAPSWTCTWPCSLGCPATTTKEETRHEARVRTRPGRRPRNHRGSTVGLRADHAGADVPRRTQSVLVAWGSSPASRPVDMGGGLTWVRSNENEGDTAAGSSRRLSSAPARPTFCLIHAGNSTLGRTNPGRHQHTREQGCWWALLAHGAASRSPASSGRAAFRANRLFGVGRGLEADLRSHHREQAAHRRLRLPWAPNQPPRVRAFYGADSMRSSPSQPAPDGGARTPASARSGSPVAPAPAACRCRRGTSRPRRWRRAGP